MNKFINGGKIARLIFIVLIAMFTTTLSLSNEVPTFAEADIRVGSCELKVLVAKSDAEKVRGMAGFSDETFTYDGMLFLGDTFRKHTYQTITMQMNIRIMGVNRISEDKYKVYGGAIYAPVGLADISVSGESVLEIPERAFASKYKYCIYQF